MDRFSFINFLLKLIISKSMNIGLFKNDNEIRKSYDRTMSSIIDFVIALYRVKVLLYITHFFLICFIFIFLVLFISLIFFIRNK